MRLTIVWVVYWLCHLNYSPCLFAQAPNDPTPSREKVIALLDSFTWNSPQGPLKMWGTSAFPFYHDLLADREKCDPMFAGRIMHLVASTEANRESFIPLSLAYFTHPNEGVRFQAVSLISAIGLGRDHTPIVALLSDESNGVSLAAATALSKLGNSSDLLAFDIWMRSATARKVNPDHLKKMNELRGQFKTRLETSKSH